MVALGIERCVDGNAALKDEQRLFQDEPDEEPSHDKDMGDLVVIGTMFSYLSCQSFLECYFGECYFSNRWSSNLNFELFWGRKGVFGDYDDDRNDDPDHELVRQMPPPSLALASANFVFACLICLPCASFVTHVEFLHHYPRPSAPDSYLMLFQWANRLLVRFETLGQIEFWAH